MGSLSTAVLRGVRFLFRSLREGGGVLCFLLGIMFGMSLAVDFAVVFIDGACAERGGVVSHVVVRFGDHSVRVN